MAPTPSSARRGSREPVAIARRLAPLSCAFLAALALALPGCGEEGSAARESAPPPSKADAKTGSKEATSGADGCPRQVGAFVKSLDTLRGRLAVGLSYDQYAAAIADLRASYNRIPIDRLELDCLTTTGTPAERALNKYIDGANAWGECLADPSCTTATIEPILQRKWRIASHHLSEAQ